LKTGQLARDSESLLLTRWIVKEALCSAWAGLLKEESSVRMDGRGRCGTELSLFLR
jgi:hypothetical protein